MKYDFDTVVNRRNTDSLKWNVAENELPMWVADMDFKTAPEITEAIKAKADLGVYGYTEISKDWYDAYTSWWERRHNFRMEDDWLMFVTGVIPAISSSVRKLTTPAENVVIMTPVYNIFFNSILNNGRNVLQSQLAYENGRYVIDFEDLEVKLKNPQTTLIILCNPQNPGGNVWSKEELARIGELAYKYGVVVISDEIHCELTMPGHEYTPFASVSQACLENSVTLNSPSKAFNTAGLQIANIVCAQSEWQRRIDRAININEVCDVNPFGVVALQAAYNEGEEWLDALRQYLYENYRALRDFLASELPQLKVNRLEATYLPWIDIRATGMPSDQFTDLVLEKSHVALSSGTSYGKAGEGYVRLNMACPRPRLMEALQRIKSCLEP